MKKRTLKTLGIALAAGLAAASFTGCSDNKINGNETALVVNGEEIPYGTANFVFRHDQALTNYYMSMMGMSADNFWSTKGTSDAEETYGQSFKTTEYSTIVRMYAVRQKAINDYNITLTDEEEQKIAEVAAEFMAANPEAAENFGADEEQLKDLLRVYTYSYDIKDSLTGDVDREVSDEEAAQSRIIYARIKKASDSDGEDAKTDEERKADLENIFEQLKAEDAQDAGTMNDIGNEVNDKFFAMEYTYGADESSLEEGIVEAANALDDNTWCDGVVETDNYFYVVKMINKFDRESTDTKKQQIIRERENEAIEEIFSQWESEAEVETKAGWDKLEANDKEVYSMKVSQ